MGARGSPGRMGPAGASVLIRVGSGPWLLADVGEQGHEPGALDGLAGGALEGGAVATPLTGEHLALVRAELLKEADVLVVDVGGAGATLRGAEAAAVLAVAAEAFPGHKAVILWRRREVDGAILRRAPGNVTESPKGIDLTILGQG